MTAREEGLLLLTSSMGDPRRKPLTLRQFRELVRRSMEYPALRGAATVTMEDMAAMGYDYDMSERVVRLFSEKERMQEYLRNGKKQGCKLVALTNPRYPGALTQRLDVDAPTLLWGKGDVSLLDKPAIALVGSRDLHIENTRFAEEVGRLAARIGYVLVSGNARGADQQAQASCLHYGGQTICVLPDRLDYKGYNRDVLYLSEDSYDLEFTSRRALSRNRIIHSMGCMTFVAQSDCGKGGTWNGTMKNLRYGWSPVYCFADGSPAVEVFVQQGATAVTTEQLIEII